jgi:hypothetical protein
LEDQEAMMDRKNDEGKREPVQPPKEKGKETKEEREARELNWRGTDSPLASASFSPRFKKEEPKKEEKDPKEKEPAKK